MLASVAFVASLVPTPTPARAAACVLNTDYTSTDDGATPATFTLTFGKIAGTAVDCDYTLPAGVTSFEYVVVGGGGGGGGGDNNSGGQGGRGGSVSTGTVSGIASGSNLLMTVGVGGSGGAAGASGADGGQSKIESGNTPTRFTAKTATGGTAGGNTGSINGSGVAGSGSGGRAAKPGACADCGVAGGGFTGTDSSLSGASVNYGAGGGGGGDDASGATAAGGNAGAGDGAFGATSATAGTNRRGGGGGGGVKANAGAARVGAAGGSGIVIIRYAADTVSPTFTSAAVNAAGTQLTLTYNEALNATTAASGQFTVTVAGSAVAVTSATVSGSTVVLVLASTVLSGQAVTVAYSDPTGGDDAAAVQDTAGNDAATLAATAATNNSTSVTTTSTAESSEESQRKEDQRKDHEKSERCAKANHAFDDCPLFPGRTTTSVATSTSTTTSSSSTTTSTTISRRITICHATGSRTNPYVAITVDVNGLSGHGDHAGDLIPAPAGGCGRAATTATSTTAVTTTTIARGRAGGPTTTTPATTTTERGRITICHATKSATNPYVAITVDLNGLSGHGDHGDDLIPAPAGGCDAGTVKAAAKEAELIAKKIEAKEKITICHATGSATNPYVEITIDVDGLAGHGDHAGDIIPAPAGGCDGRSVTKALDAKPKNNGRISICHATGSATNPYVEITIDMDGLAGHGDHQDDLIPAPAGGCPREMTKESRQKALKNNDRITICHATASATNPYVEITIDVDGLAGHGDHEDDIIPAPAEGCGKGAVQRELAERDKPKGRITICHATGSAKNPYVEITIDMDGLAGHGDHLDDLIPAPAEGCGEKSVEKRLKQLDLDDPEEIEICHATKDPTRPYVAATVDADTYDGHGQHDGDIVPAPAKGCTCAAIDEALAAGESSDGSLNDTIDELNDSRNGGPTTDLYELVELEGKKKPGGSGGKGGSISLTPEDDAPSMTLLSATSDDPNLDLSITSSGADYNKPSVWQAEGFGEYCWKLEPFGDSDYRYTLPNPSAPPDSAYAGLPYSSVIVKAGSLKETDPDYQVNTVFMNPEGGTAVFADINKNGISDPGGQGGGLLGDKSISHIILCVGEGEYEEIAVTTTTSSTPDSSATSAPTTTAAPRRAPSACPVPEDGTTTTTVRATTTTTAPTTTAPGATTTTTAPGATTTTTTTAPGATTTTTTAPGATTTTTAPGATTTTTAPGATTTTTTTAPGATTTTTTPGATTTTTTTAPGATTTTTAPGATTTTAAPTTGTTTTPPSSQSPVLAFSVTPKPGTSLPEEAKITLVVSTGSDIETIVITANLQTFEVNVPYAELILNELPTTGAERWSRDQMLGWMLALLGVAMLAAATPVPRRRRR